MASRILSQNSFWTIFRGNFSCSFQVLEQIFIFPLIFSISMGKKKFPDKIGKKLGKIIFSKFSIVSMSRLISLYATSAFIKCKICALSRKLYLCTERFARYVIPPHITRTDGSLSDSAAHRFSTKRHDDGLAASTPGGGMSPGKSDTASPAGLTMKSSSTSKLSDTGEWLTAVRLCFHFVTSSSRSRNWLLL